MSIDRETLLRAANIDGRKLTVLDSTDSTNRVAAEMAAEGAGDMTAVLSEKQFSGRGRLGRSFFSPEESGIYLSIIARPGSVISARIAQMPGLLTAVAGVESAAAIKRTTGISVGLKWVNDIVINGRKAGGILTESRSREGGLEWAVIGIGVNIFDPPGGFPEELKNTAASLTGRPAPNDCEASGSAFSPPIRELIAGNIIRGISASLEEFRQDPDGASVALYADYKSLVGWMFGKKICVKNNITGGSFFAVADDISEDLGLILRPEDRPFETLKLYSGEVSVRTAD